LAFDGAQPELPRPGPARRPAERVDGADPAARQLDPDPLVVEAPVREVPGRRGAAAADAEVAPEPGANLGGGIAEVDAGERAAGDEHPGGRQGRDHRLFSSYCAAPA